MARKVSIRKERVRETKGNALWCEAPGAQKKGAYSVSESSAVLKAADEYAREAGYRDAADLVTAKTDTKKYMDGSNPWVRLAEERFPSRSPVSLFSHVRRKCHPGARRGQWSEQETKLLWKKCQRYGTRWNDIAVELGRTAESCRDRFRLAYGERAASALPEKTKTERQVSAQGRVDKEYFKKTWSEEEVARLVSASVNGICILDLDDASEISWKALAETVATKSVQQCKQKFEELSHRKRTYEHDDYTMLHDSAAHRLDFVERILAAVKASNNIDSIPWHSLGYDIQAAQRIWSELKPRSSQNLLADLDAIIVRLQEKVHRDLLQDWQQEDASSHTNQSIKKKRRTQPS